MAQHVVQNTSKKCIVALFVKVCKTGKGREGETCLTLGENVVSACDVPGDDGLVSSFLDPFIGGAKWESYAPRNGVTQNLQM